MKHLESQLTATDGLKLFAQAWVPDRESQAVVALVHGVGEHSTRYAHVAERFGQAGYATHTFDLRGHGRSPGEPRTYVHAFEEHLADVDEFLKWVRPAAAGKPLFLMGHSMGGAIVALYTITRQLKLNGLIVSSGALKPGADVSPLLISLAQIISAVAPKLGTLKIDPAAVITRDPEMLHKAVNDPLSYYGASPARTGAEILKAMRRIQESAAQITLPVLIFHGTGDKLTNPEGSQELYARVGSSDKTLKLYEGAYHETLNDLGREQVMDDIVAWMNARQTI